jgi:PAS domain S-box-containing protein
MNTHLDPELLLRRLARAEQRTQILDALHEDRAREAYLASAQLRAASISLAELFRAVPGAIIVIGSDGLVEAVNDETLRMLGWSEGELIGGAQQKIFGESWVPAREANPVQVLRTERELRTRNGHRVPVLLSITIMDTGHQHSVVCVAIDLTERKKLEAELLHAHKLESIGRLAAGVAHEINTPIQFISDSVRFARDAVADIAAVYDKYRKIRDFPTSGAALAEQLRELDVVEAQADTAFLFEQLPGALERAMEGLQQVANIVRATKDFAYPTTREKRPANINKALQSTLTIGKREYAEIANVQADLGELPLVPCHIGELNQVFLNLIINAAHAIHDRKRGGRGTITVRTFLEWSNVLIVIGDDGDGIPESIQPLIFDPFFTTKDVGRGSGQGLAIARSVVVDRHGGSLEFETKHGEGTQFFVRIPASPPRPTLAPMSRVGAGG